jgi:hypothetical protein
MSAIRYVPCSLSGTWHSADLRTKFYLSSEGYAFFSLSLSAFHGTDTRGWWDIVSLQPFLESKYEQVYVQYFALVFDAYGRVCDYCAGFCPCKESIRTGIPYDM